MNAQPHVHDLTITENSKRWLIAYGDQQKYVEKPVFRNPSKVLNSAVRKMITEHDAKSREAGEKEAHDKQVINSVLAQFKYIPAPIVTMQDIQFHRYINTKERYTLPDSEKWGSEQISKK